jgi:hypothetical protein
MLREDARMQALRELAYLLARSPELLLGAQHAFSRWRSGSRLPGGSQGALELLEPTLRAVVEPTLESTPLFVARLQEASAGGLQLHDPGLDVRLESSVRRREASRRRDGLSEAGVLEHRRVVHDHRDRRAAPLHERRRPAGARVGHRHSAPRGVDEAVCARDRVPDLERRVAERP